ncbi:L-serine ammonia-lyase, iron-sulfur-dependent subunit beta [Sinanaerobacter sp. ZZT-01]|uniref:L-serine ammonia-lyase, iron-sulfur-dependent subunit beta n=1 Tax=Sinanaerobacter sp. ZZT-01 TaxID=3111540 RepID=UPI002D79981D|nr:L-serine ammonia-lyase, iron-sulfur-dependent subunit beta [Sinanaerobacter sp. ZZT-01]WRR94412.1 L-serine ammonia-lyase, iron-sulfur-dependent subunit beta [Sinanaerobacter sp. ZZT-01]
MDVSIFDVTGPIMIGPSSSHTAGAAKLARIARQIVGVPFTHVSFGLYGSFAKTYQGHGTDKALVAGALGLREDDERLREAFYLAKKEGLTFDFYETDLDGMHENSVKITFFRTDGLKTEIIGSSIGGGQIIIKYIDGFETEVTAQSPTLVIRQYDRKGVVSDISAVLANNNINIGIMKLSRLAKGKVASTIIETDDMIPYKVVESLGRLENVISVKAIESSV